MKRNVCGLDRTLRVLVGLALIGSTLAGAIGIWGWIGIVPLITGILRFCPAYAIFGLETCPVAKD
ncbi:MAG: DUF2892 domain-containing protein [Proteobacteria bacterium]|nr:DUF2892 domain-containing protein [Pseudomonadota bacterium]